MIASTYQIIFTVVVVCLSVCFIKRRIFKRKLWWVNSVPGYPILGNILDFTDPTRSLDVMKQYLANHNGLCYTEFLLQPNLFASDLKFLKWFLSSNSPLQKGDVYQSLKAWLGAGILISAGDEWRNSRKILTPAFHFSILEQFIEVFEDATNVLIEVLGKEVNKEEVDIHPLVTRYALDVVCQTSMGVQLNIQEQHHSDYLDAVAEMGKIVVERAFNPLKFFELTYKLSRDYRKEKKLVKLLHGVSNSIIEKRRKEIEGRQDLFQDDVGKKRRMAFLDLLLKYRNENGEPLSDGFIRQEVDTVMFAGHDTTAAALGFAMYSLAKHPDVQAKALNEVKEIVGEKSKLTIRDLQELKYLDLVIKETLRLYPSVPFYAKKLNEDMAYDGDKILPKGLTVTVVAHTVNRDPSIYEQPDHFIPTRYLEKEPVPFSNLPFSAGPRNCLGQKFAILELKMALAKILLNFHLFAVDPPFEPILEALTVLKSRNGIKIRLKNRA